MPSARVVVAVNTPSAGGLDLVMVRAEPPVLLTVKELVVTEPNGAEPNATAAGVTWSCPGVPLVPDRSTVTDPPSLSRSSASMFWPAAVGA